MHHKVVVCQAAFGLAGVGECRAAVELRALGAPSLSIGQHRESSSLGFIQTLCGGAALQLAAAAGVSSEATLHVLQLRQTPALQLTDQRHLLGAERTDGSSIRGRVEDIWLSSRGSWGSKGRWFDQDSRDKNVCGVREGAVISLQHPQLKFP